MKPRIHVVTLAVDDLHRSLRFYRDGLGFPSAGIIGTQFAATERDAAGAVAMFKLDRGLILCCYPRRELAKDANVPLLPAKTGEMSLGHAVESRESVDALLAAARAAGATVTDAPRDRPWGIYSGYFRDPDGHLWEVLWNPGLEDV